jgi:hypothetical protein
MFCSAGTAAVLAGSASLSSDALITRAEPGMVHRGDGSSDEVGWLVEVPTAQRLKITVAGEGDRWAGLLASRGRRWRSPMMATSQFRSVRRGPPAPYADMDESAPQEVLLAWPVDQRCRLLQAERPGVHLRKGQSGLAQLVELG